MGGKREYWLTMANIKIPDLAPLVGPLSGAELMEVSALQSEPGAGQVSRRVTTAQIAAPGVNAASVATAIAENAQNSANDALAQADIAVAASEAAASTVEMIGALVSTGIPVQIVPATTDSFVTVGYSTAGDGGGAQFVRASGSTLGGFQSADGQWWQIADLRLTPQQFGVFDDPSMLLDQSARVKNWFDACVATGRAPHVDRPLNVMVATPVSYAPVANAVPKYINLARLRIGSPSGGCIRFGSPSSAMYLATLHTPQIVRVGTTVWLPDERASMLSDDAGLILYNLISFRVHVGAIAGFTIGYALESSGGSFYSAYNVLTFSSISDCRYHEVLRCTGSGGFVNENTLIGGRRGNYSTVNALGNSYGTVITSSDAGYKGNNTNRWYSPCYELGAPASAEYRTPVLLDRTGVFNYWHLPRHESGKGPFGIANNGSGASSNGGCLNEVIYGYQAGAGADFYKGWHQRGGAFGNIARHPTSTPQPKWQSGPMAQKISASGDTRAQIEAPYFFKANTAATPLAVAASSGAVRANARCVQIEGQNAVLIEVDTSNTKTWRLSGAFVANRGGRYFVQAFDAAGAVLSGTTTDEWGTETYVKGLSATTTLFGGGYQSSSDTPSCVIFTVRDDVASMHVGYHGGTSGCALVGFELEAFPGTYTSSIGITTPLVNVSSTRRTASANPGTSGVHGWYTPGEIIGSTSPTSGTPVGWIVSAGAALADAWAGSTTYAVLGRCVVNGGNVYKLRTPGTSASSGGPTGTGVAIADGTCEWDYVCPKAVFAPLPPMP
ncbi:hypothetical protein [Ancylobacter sp.]|uniref:hypothetical protein n=1 Tax=Ancylobacter sp. TaxID=1872567 RepID=UPI003BAC157C